MAFEREARGVLSLQEICEKAILKYYRKCPEVLHAIQYFDAVDWMIGNGHNLRHSLAEYMAKVQESLKRKYGNIGLEKMLSSDSLELFHLKIEQLAGEKQVRIVGKVVERESADQDLKSDKCRRALTQSVSGKLAYPYSSLRAGLRWPPDVDPTTREEYLSSNDSEEVFGVPYNAYKNLPLWKRQVLKKDKHLF